MAGTSPGENTVSHRYDFARTTVGAYCGDTEGVRELDCVPGPSLTRRVGNTDSTNPTRQRGQCRIKYLNSRTSSEHTGRIPIDGQIKIRSVGRSTCRNVRKVGVF